MDLNGTDRDQCAWQALGFHVKGAEKLDDRQITHLICVRQKKILYDFLGGVWGLLPLVCLI